MASEAKLLTLRSGSTDERRKAGETSARVKLIRERRARAWTHEQLALWLGCSVDAVQLWESGKRRVPAWPLEVLSAHQQRFFAPNDGTFCHARKLATLRACTEPTVRGRQCEQPWDVAARGAATEGVARKAAA